MHPSKDELDYERCGTSHGHCQLLLPGLPDHLTVEHIATKIPWRSVQALSCVSSVWCHAIRTREVHRARVRWQSTEEFAIVYYECGPRNSVGLPGCLCLYSMRDNLCLELPPPPLLGTFIALDGRLYLIGGLCRNSDQQCDVYVLDLSGQRLWKQCSSMNYSRSRFACGVLHGKIYVFGGTSKGVFGRTSMEVFGVLHDSYKSAISLSEVYDPEKDIWSPISPMTSLRCDHQVETVGEELFVYGGLSPRILPNGQYLPPKYLRAANFYGVYNPGRDEWRVVRPDSNRVLFKAHGNLYSMSRNGIIDIHVLDADGNSRTQLESDSGVVRVLAPFDDFEVRPSAIVALKNELLAIVADDGLRYYLLRTRGFCERSGEIGWEKTRLPLSSPPSPDHPWRLSRKVFCCVGL